MPNPLTQCPTRITIGTTVKWYLDANADDVTPDEYDVSYTFSNSSESFSVDATDNGDERYLVTIASGISGQWDAGDEYFYSAQATHSTNGEAYVVDWGSIRTDPNYAIDATYDGRTHARKVYDELKDIIEGRMDQDTANYSIGTGSTQRSVSMLSPEELIDAYNYYKRQVLKEINRERVRKGKSSLFKTWGRF